MSTNIIVTTCNYLPCTQLCIRSIVENTFQPYHLVVVDDGSSDGTVEWIRRLSNCTVIENGGKRHGWWAGNNLGIRAGLADYYAFLDRDMIVTRGWLDKLIALLRQRPDMGIVSPVMNAGVGEQGIPQGGDEACPWPEKWGTKQHFVPNPLSYEEVQEYGAHVEALNKCQYIYNAPLWLPCAVVPRSTIEKLGGFDERFFWADGDLDYSYRALKAGRLLAVRLDTYAHHQVRGYDVTNYYGPQPLTYWYEKYPGTAPSRPENRDWNDFLPHKNVMEVME